MEVDVFKVLAAIDRAPVLVESCALKSDASLGMGRKRTGRSYGNCRGLDIEFDRSVYYRTVFDSIKCPNLEYVVTLLSVTHVYLEIPRTKRAVGLGDLALCHATCVDSKASTGPLICEWILDLYFVDISSLIPLGQLV